MKNPMKKFFSKSIQFLKKSEESELSVQEMQAAINEEFEKATEPKDESRQFFRVAFLHPAVGTLRIAKINGKPVSLKHARVLISEMGPGGLQFLSDLSFPTEHNLVLSFETILLGEIIQVNGKIEWKQEKDGFIRYGITFVDVDNEKRKELTQHLNNVVRSLKKEKIYPKSHFYRGDIEDFFEDKMRKI